MATARTPHDAQALGTLAAFLATKDRDHLPVVYLAGPMADLPEFSLPDLQEHARKLRTFGFPVLNPADLGADVADHGAAALGARLDLLRHADLLVLLPDWEDDPEVRAEFDAFTALGRPIVTLETFLRKVLLYYVPRQEALAIMRLDARRLELNVAYEPPPGGAIYVGDRREIQALADLADVADLVRKLADLDEADLRDDDAGAGTAPAPAAAGD
jgi:hypothetical protein